MSDAAAAEPKTKGGPGYRAYVLFILVVVYTFNFLDRQIIGILAPAIQLELELTDTQLGLMGGIAFAVLYSTLGVPIAWLADRFDRVWIMSGALTVWSGMTAVCGLAGNFWQLFLARVGVGVGEAGGVAPAYTLIADYFPANQRARALAIYSFGIPIGSAVGIVFGGVVAALIDWRAAFIIVGLAGVALAPVFKLTVREPRAMGLGAAAQPDGASGGDALRRIGIGAAIGAGFGLVSVYAIALIRAAFGDGSFLIPGYWHLGFVVAGMFIGGNLGFTWSVFRVLLKKWRTFILISFGTACSSMMGYGLFFWIPGFIIRSYGEALPEFFAWAPSWLIPEGMDPARELVLMAAYFYGAIVLIGGVIGIAAGGVLGDWLGKSRKANYALLPAVAFLITAPLFALGVVSPSLTAAFFILLVPTALGLIWIGPVLTAFQHLVEPHMRATASAIWLLINNLLGIGGGVYALGALSDGYSARFGDEALRYAILTGTGLYVVAAGLFIVAAFTLKRDWVD